MADRRSPKPPPVLWAVFDPDPDTDASNRIVGWHFTKREADKDCRRANRLPGYVTKCVVVRYGAEKGGEGSP